MHHVTGHSAWLTKGQYVTYIQIRQFREDFWLFYPVLFIFILWHSPFSNPPKIHSRSAENMVALDEIGSLSHTFRQGDEMKHSSGVSQSQRGDEQFVILQYPLLTKISACHKLSGEVTKFSFCQVCHSHIRVTNHSKLYSNVSLWTCICIWGLFKIFCHGSVSPYYV